MAPFLVLDEDREFWNCTLDGLAVLGAPGMLRAYRLPRTVTELAVVADTLHVHRRRLGARARGTRRSRRCHLQETA